MELRREGVGLAETQHDCEMGCWKRGLLQGRMIAHLWGDLGQHSVYRNNAVARRLRAEVAIRRHPELQASWFPVSHLQRRGDRGWEILTCAIGERHCDVLTGTSFRRVQALLKLEVSRYPTSCVI